MNSLFSSLFELIFRSDSGISNDLYDNNLYGILGIVMLILPIVIGSIFYFVMNHARYAQVKFWLMMFFVNFIITFLFSLFFPKGQLEDMGNYYPFADYLYLASVVSFWSMLIFFVYSLVVKRFSSNLARTPF